MNQLERISPRLDSPLSLIGILGAAFAVRASNLSYNTAFLDEAAYIVTGHRLLHGAPIGHYGWIGGFPYFYPVFSALVDRLDGLEMVRLANVIFGIGTILIIYLLTRILFDSIIALLGAAVYGASAAPIAISRLATYDAMSIFFLSLAIFLLAKGLQKENRKFTHLATLTGFCSFLAKYVAGFYLAFISLMLIFHVKRTWVWRSFVIPLVWLSGLYAVVFGPTLIWPFLTGQLLSKHGASEATNAKIVVNAIIYLGPAMIPSLVAFMRKPDQRCLSLTLMGGALLILIYHFANQTPQALYKHAAYGLTFLAPVAGLGLSSMLSGLRDYIRQKHNWARRIAHTLGFLMILVLMMILWSISWQAIPNQESFWPNAGRSVAYLSQRLKGDEIILAESSSVYEYYLQLHAPRLEALSIENNFGWFAYEGQTGDEAILRAINDNHFDFVVLDGVFTPELDEKILARVEGRYELLFTDPAEAIPGKGIISIFKRIDGSPP